ncbi:hypothetical protein [Streptomyces sp. NBC_01264]|uniref:hypothetical protein n=1 Tax=Streptomyces sp. NBC_01264 TaxID=2903804 RepID=UPI0022541894|nr:hypothetical protein [Streptomyces sp. NBC_01264]MCX4784617.1 hypothetical protein [Streptomyces sp. NBC_01264]
MISVISRGAAVALALSMTALAGPAFATGVGGAATGSTPHKSCDPITLTTNEAKFTLVDLGAPGEGIGDLTVITANLLSNERPVGTFAATFTKVMQEPSDKTTVGGGVFELEDGQVSFASKQTFPNKGP